MGESTKSVLALLTIMGIAVAAVAWIADHPDSMTWGFRIGALVTAGVAFGLFLKLHFRADNVSSCW